MPSIRPIIDPSRHIARCQAVASKIFQPADQGVSARMGHGPQSGAWRYPVATSPAHAATVETLIPARLDRLPWSRFHWLLVIGLGITWVLDGLEVTLVGAIGAVLQRPDVLHFSATQIGAISSFYLAGAVAGSLVFGHLTDRYGRRTFFFISLAIY